ncbi:trehalose-6-phosphate hydrolase [Gracilibacillus boraciitolerans JCM 21714]|uniref:Trehalose-6-phosphate hydrolase n=1 Tax=Gracilibacillus boraciitolerans JCM 21714 TaxID=1298598 RepID=W4VG11_9BACI|nr:trehalose-6-phosphate hydrolase [Gracilibacillus boraciitolerans JCM 21714]
MAEEDIIAILKEKSRDNSRTPVQWNNKENAGFSNATPWIEIPDNYRSINAEQAIENPNSIFHHYQKLIALRKQYQVITDGDYQLLLSDHLAIFAYLRENKSQRMLVVNNFYAEEVTLELPEDVEKLLVNGKIIISNYLQAPASIQNVTLRPYESFVYFIQK